MEKEESKVSKKMTFTQIFSWGNNKHGQLGLGDSGEEYETHNLPRSIIFRWATIFIYDKFTNDCYQEIKL